MKIDKLLETLKQEFNDVAWVDGMIIIKTSDPTQTKDYIYQKLLQYEYNNSFEIIFSGPAAEEHLKNSTSLLSNKSTSVKSNLSKPKKVEKPTIESVLPDIKESNNGQLSFF